MCIGWLMFVWRLLDISDSYEVKVALLPAGGSAPPAGSSTTLLLSAFRGVGESEQTRFHLEDRHSEGGEWRLRGLNAKLIFFSN